MQMKNKTNELETITVCLCTYKRHAVRDTLESICKQALTDEVKINVVVVDNDPRKSARQIVDDYIAKAPFNIKYVSESQPGISAARNCAVKHAEGNWLAFLDDDEYAEPSWLFFLLDCARKYEAKVVIGEVETIYPHSAPPWIVKGDYFKKHLAKTGSSLVVGSTANCLVHSDIFKQLQIPFQLNFGQTGGEDTDFFSRVHRAGNKIITCKEAKVSETVEENRLTKEFLIRKAIRVGETYSKIFIKPLPLITKTTALMRAFIQMCIAAVISVLMMPFGKARYFRFVIKMYSNWGKLREALSIRPIQLYQRGN
jgi:succinoglycan biosynthesis protein ExoM